MFFNHVEGNCQKVLANIKHNSATSLATSYKTLQQILGSRCNILSSGRAERQSRTGETEWKKFCYCLFRSKPREVGLLHNNQTF